MCEGLKAEVNRMETPIRIATLADLRSIFEIENLCFAIDQFSQRQLRYLITKAKASVIVIESSSDIAGYSILLTPKNLKSARIYSLAIHPNEKGKGLGQMLVQHLLSVAVNSGYQQVNLEVRDDNTTAIRLYESLGFQQTAIKEDYYEDGMRARVYRIHLKHTVLQN